MSLHILRFSLLPFSFAFSVCFLFDLWSFARSWADFIQHCLVFPYSSVWERRALNSGRKPSGWPPCIHLKSSTRHGGWFHNDISPIFHLGWSCGRSFLFSCRFACLLFVCVCLCLSFLQIGCEPDGMGEQPRPLPGIWWLEQHYGLSEHQLFPWNRLYI